MFEEGGYEYFDWNWMTVSQVKYIIINQSKLFEKMDTT